jgi:CheY-like chemotaxis protein
MRLLWVENHAVFVRVARRLFLSGHDLTVVPSLAAARQALAEQDFDAVLIDYDLDDGKGESLLAFVQALSSRPAVVGVSAHEAGNDALLRAGADEVCSKARFAEIGSVLAALSAKRDESRRRSS